MSESIENVSEVQECFHVYIFERACCNVFLTLPDQQKNFMVEALLNVKTILHLNSQVLTKVAPVQKSSNYHTLQIKQFQKNGLTFNTI